MTSSIMLLFVIVGWDLTSALSSSTKNQIVDLHNNVRKNEPATNMNMLHWDNDLAYNAQAWTDKCHFAHQSGKYWGENLSVRTSHGNQTLDIEEMFGYWMAEKKFNTGGTFEECCGRSHSSCCHFTQVIWAATTQIGCGVTKCDHMTTSGHSMRNALFMACYYNPPGNRPVSKCTFDWSPYIPQ